MAANQAVKLISTANFPQLFFSSVKVEVLQSWEPATDLFSFPPP
jgi:hypothetical protein